MTQSLKMILLLLLCVDNLADTQTVPPSNKPVSRQIVRCHDNRCADLTYNQILRRYHGMFYTRKQLRKMKLLKPRSRNNPNNRRKKRDDDDDANFVGDLDKCCPTFNTLLIRSALRNTKGELRYIVNLLDMNPPMIQFIPQGRCLSGNGQCTDCKQLQKLQTLLVVDPTTTPPCVTFDMFYINSYCFCSNL